MGVGDLNYLQALRVFDLFPQTWEGILCISACENQRQIKCSVGRREEEEGERGETGGETESTGSEEGRCYGDLKELPESAPRLWL